MHVYYKNIIEIPLFQSKIILAKKQVAANKLSKEVYTARWPRWLVVCRYGLCTDRWSPSQVL